MNRPVLNLAIETSSLAGSVSLGSGDDILETRSLGPQKRHAVALLPAIDQMLKDRNYQPADLSEVFVSAGPGSFTGLRVGITTAKLIAEVTQATVYAVPSLPVIACNIPLHHPFAAVFLNAKRGQGFAQIFRSRPKGWEPLASAQLLSPAELCRQTPGPLVIAMDAFCQELIWPEEPEKLDVSFSVPSSAHVHALGRRMAERRESADPVHLTPLYVRLPEAEEVWRNKQKETV